VFISTLTCKYMKEKKDLIHSIQYHRIIIILLSVCIITSICEWLWFLDGNNFGYNGSAFPSLTRISVVAGAGFCFLISFYVHRPSPSVIRYLSDYSLGLYCLHGFVYWYYEKYKILMGFSFHNAINLIIVVGISLTVSILLRRVLRTGLI
jgi:fucose 4-O-acetylase-like acetyltransferase